MRSNAPTAALPFHAAGELHPHQRIRYGYVGPVVLPGSGRLIYWTGRVAIGLRHDAKPAAAQAAA